MDMFLGVIAVGLMAAMNLIGIMMLSNELREQGYANRKETQEIKARLHWAKKRQYKLAHDLKKLDRWGVIG